MNTLSKRTVRTAITCKSIKNNTTIENCQIHSRKLILKLDIESAQLLFIRKFRQFPVVYYPIYIIIFIIHNNFVIM